MITRYRVSLNNSQLDQLFKSVYPNGVIIKDIEYPTPVFNRTVETPGSSDGGVVTREYRQSASVTVKFELHIYDVEKRKQVCGFIQLWASKGGTLRTNDRAGQVLNNVICESFPDINSAKNWTDELSMTFTAYDFPYWQMESSDKRGILYLNGTNANGELACYGNAKKAPVTVEATPKASGMNRLKITVGSSMIELTGISVSTSQSVKIGYDKTGNITIGLYNGNKLKESLLSYRTAQSSDYLYADCNGELRFYAGSDGQTPSISEVANPNQVNITSNVNVGVTLNTRGAWL